MKNKEKHEMTFKTRDNLVIAANLYRGSKPSKTLLVLAPGFAQFKDSNILTEMSESFSSLGDLVCLDFRGTGKSQGRYDFGANEYQDLEPILRWGRKHYKKNVLIGLSLGGYHAVRAAREWPKSVDQVMLVSSPTCVEDVVKTGGPLLQFTFFLTDWKSLKRRLGLAFNLFFNWGNPFSRKPDASQVVKEVKTPLDVLVGGRDMLVQKRLTERIYRNAPNQNSWTCFEKGHHSELMYLQDESRFKNWLASKLIPGRNGI
jgi:pimeloyl-ACP methyl ester carboxylesterase